jgi:hypothetical protein
MNSNLTLKAVFTAVSIAFVTSILIQAEPAPAQSISKVQNHVSSQVQKVTITGKRLTLEEKSIYDQIQHTSQSVVIQGKRITAEEKMHAAD